jgi:hypothetical protein
VEEPTPTAGLDRRSRIAVTIIGTVAVVASIVAVVANVLQDAP